MRHTFFIGQRPDCWLVVKTLLDGRKVAIARYANRAKAEDHAWSLNWLIKGANYRVIFDLIH